MFVSNGEDFQWEVLDILSGNDLLGTKSPRLTPEQTVMVLEVIGSRFGNVPLPIGTWSGHHNPWDASNYVGGEVGRLAELHDPEGEQVLQRLLSLAPLHSYHDLIRHRLAQRAGKRRDLEFVFGAPESIARALNNEAPATAVDLLAYTVDHLAALNREIKSTQMELYRGYWNHDGPRFLNPKQEEDCSGLLASDLQNRLRSHGLVVSVEHHMVANKECDLVVRQGISRLLPIEVKHHYHAELWNAWKVQLDRLYTRDAGAGGLGIYLVLWSGETRKTRRIPKLPPNVTSRPTNAIELQRELERQIPDRDQGRLRVVVIDIAELERTS